MLITMVKTTSIASQDIHLNAIKVFSKSKEKDKKNKKLCTILFILYRKLEIILSGDIKTNPGTGLSEPKCKVCDKTV